MLKRVDRIQLTSHNADATARQWCALLDAEVSARDEVAALGARRVTVHVGDSLAEILEPTSDGLAQQHLQAGRGGPFSVGFNALDDSALRTHLESQNIHPVDLGQGQYLLTETQLGIPGLTVVVSPHESRTSVGLVDRLYEATHLTDDPAASSAIARLFGLEEQHFVRIESETFGYRGTLTLFDPTQLHRVESIDPFDRSKTMGRYFERFGPSLYMCYAEVESIRPLRDRLAATAPSDWTGSTADDDVLFVHPRALGGVMMGVSRLSHAWTWSGYPERRTPSD